MDVATDPFAQRLTDVFMRADLNFFNIKSFRKIAEAGPLAVSEGIYQEYFQIPEVLDSIGWQFSDREQVFSEDFRRDIAGKMTERRLQNAQAAVDAASLVFAHSILDDAASECCKVSSLVAPEDWRTNIEQRKVPLERVRNASFDDLYHEYLSEFMEQLTREPLMKRMEFLNQKCQPVHQMMVHKVKYNYDPERVKALDKPRHDVIHRVAINQQFPTIEADLEFLEHTCRFVVRLIVQHYRVRLDLDDWIKRQQSGN